MRNRERLNHWAPRILAITVLAAFAIASAYTARLDIGPSLGAQVIGPYFAIRPPLGMIIFAGIIFAACTALLISVGLCILDLVLGLVDFAKERTRRSSEPNRGPMPLSAGSPAASPGFKDCTADRNAAGRCPGRIHPKITAAGFSSRRCDQPPK